MGKPKIAITIGDIAGIGPEIIKKALASKKIKRICSPIVVGSGTAFKLKRGRISKKAAEYAMQALREAVNMAMSGEVKAIVTAPINKEGIYRAGYKFQGHTDYLKYLTGAKSVSMMLISPQMKVILVTVHTRLRDVSKKLSKSSVLRTIRHAVCGAKMLGVKKPRVAVCALNPHGGEIGDEEGKYIVPAVKMAKKEKINVSGPFPSDTLFHKVLDRQFDIVVAMYHDQGLIPLKMLGFEEGVNVSVGLPIIRTSPDHGTAYDIAGRGKADPTSMIKAIEAAVKIVNEIQL